MTRFEPRRLHFGAGSDQDDDAGNGLPTPARIRLLSVAQ